MNKMSQSQGKQEMKMGKQCKMACSHPTMSPSNGVGRTAHRRVGTCAEEMLNPAFKNGVQVLWIQTLFFPVQIISYVVSKE